MGEAVQIVLLLLPLQGLGSSLDLVACTEGRYLLEASPLSCGVLQALWSKWLQTESVVPRLVPMAS